MIEKTPPEMVGFLVINPAIKYGTMPLAGCHSEGAWRPKNLLVQTERFIAEILL